MSAGVGLALNGPGAAPEGDYNLVVSAAGDAAAGGAGVSVAVKLAVNWGDGSMPYDGVVPATLLHNYDGLSTPTDYTIKASAVGRSVTSTPGAGTISDAALDATGRRVTVGRNSAGDWEIRRYNTNGTPDATFDGDGVVTRDFLFGDDNARAVAIDALGKIVVVGSGSAVDQFIVARYTAAGAPDTTFGGGAGFVTTAFTGAEAVATSVAIGQPSGYIVVGGRSSLSPTQTDFALARYLPNGDADTTFDGDGKLTTVFGDSSPLADIALRSGGGIVAVGGFNGNATAVAAYTASGALDLTFDTDGKLTLDVAAGESEDATAVVVQDDGNILIGGDAGSFFLTLVRLTPAGALDATFSGDGKVAETVIAGFSATVGTLSLQDDGGFVVGASLSNTTLGSQGGLALVRYTAGGTRDTAFGDGGLVFTDAGSAAVSGGHAALLPGGHIVQSGTRPAGAANDALAVFYETVNFSVTITNVAPTAAFHPSNPTNLLPGEFGEFFLLTSDPSIDDASFLRFQINWGDGTTEEFFSGGGVLPVAHAYTVSGMQTITLTVSDDDGGVGTATLTVNVDRAGVVPDLLVGDGTQMMLVIADPNVGPHSGASRISIRPSIGGQEVWINGSFFAFYPTTDRVVVYGNNGNDDIEAASNLGRPVEFYGGSGNDRLRGGDQSDILIGGGGNDLAVGGAGRDFLVGDGVSAFLSIGGVDRIVGDTGEDILIGGFTTWADDRAALAGILAEWSSARTYVQRVDNLRGIAPAADRANGNYFLVADVTVRDDLVIDILTGGADRDWFFANADGFLRDRITDLNASEFVDDLDFIFTV